LVYSLYSIRGCFFSLQWTCRNTNWSGMILVYWYCILSCNVFQTALDGKSNPLG
jgi:hypothetical protein